MKQKQDDYCGINCTKCGTPIGHSEIFVNDVIESPKEYHIKGSENITSAHLLCDECYGELPE
jgi:hypothetical protein